MRRIGLLFLLLTACGGSPGDAPTRSSTTEATTTTVLAPLGFEGNAGDYAQCETLFTERAAADAGKTQFVADCMTGDLTEAQLRP